MVMWRRGAPTHPVACRRAQSEQLDLEAQVEAFMKKQAEMESGGACRRGRVGAATSTVRPPHTPHAAVAAAAAAFAGTVQRDGPIGTEVVDNEVRRRVHAGTVVLRGPCSPQSRLFARALQTARTYCREVFEALKQLKANRDMSVGEVKLVIQIEDPNLKVRAARTLSFAQACNLRLGAGRPGPWCVAGQTVVLFRCALLNRVRAGGAQGGH